jgi:hypothetical protein
MRKMMTRAAVAAAVFSAAALLAGPTNAMTLGTPSGVVDAAKTINPVDSVACWRYGWRGWGWYPCGWVRPYPYYGAYGGWGWRRPYWGWRRPWGWHGGWRRW